MACQEVPSFAATPLAQYSVTVGRPLSAHWKLYMDYDRTFGLLRHVDPISREKIKNAIELRLENLFDDIEEIRVDARELQHEVRHILQGACA